EALPVSHDLLHQGAIDQLVESVRLGVQAQQVLLRRLTWKRLKADAARVDPAQLLEQLGQRLPLHGRRARHVSSPSDKPGFPRPYHAYSRRVDQAQAKRPGSPRASRLIR